MAPAVSLESATGLHDSLPLKPEDALYKLNSSAYSCSRCTGPVVDTVPLLQFCTMDSDTSRADTRDSPETNDNHSNSNNDDDDDDDDVRERVGN